MNGDDSFKLDWCQYCREYGILNYVVVGRCVFWLCSYCLGGLENE